MEKGRKDTVLLTVIGIATLLVAIVGATFAFFTARVTNNDTVSTLIIKSSSGSTITFIGGDKLTAENIYPRGTADAKPWIVKPFRITYNNAATGYDYTYQLKLNYTNSFGTGEVRYDLIQTDGYCSKGMVADEATCTDADGNNGTWTAVATQVGTRPTKTGTLNNVGTTVTEIDLGNGIIPAGTTNATHTYALKISYPDTGENQNYTNQISNRTNQGQSLTAWVSIDEIANTNNG